MDMKYIFHHVITYIMNWNKFYCIIPLLLSRTQNHLKLYLPSKLVICPIYIISHMYKTISEHLHKKGLKNKIKNSDAYFINNITYGHKNMNVAVCGIWRRVVRCKFFDDSNDPPSGRGILLNVGKLLLHYPASHPRIQ